MARRRRRRVGSAGVITPIASATALLLLFLVPIGFHHGNNSLFVSGKAVFSIEEACGNMNFTENQEKHYGKTEFLKHANLAETVGNLLSVFYNGDNDTWSIRPEDLQDVVLSNIHKVQGTQIYGSAIAFEPNVWKETEGLEDGVVSFQSTWCRIFNEKVIHT